MAEEFICVLAEFDEQTQSEMGRLYSALHKRGLEGRQTKGIPYHLTLGYFSLDMEEELKGLMEEVSSDTTSFDLTFSHLGLFGYEVLFYTPDVNYELLDLKQRICDGRTNEKRGWTAHATILIDDEENIKRGLEIASKEFKQFIGRVESISLYAFFPKRLIKRYRLK